MKNGILIVFEGIDGSGKSSCMDAAVSEISKKRDVIRTSEPTKGVIGQLIRTHTDVTPETEALLFTADRAEHTKEMKKWLDNGKIVMCDRYYASTLAYQSAYGVISSWLRKMNEPVIIEPDITFLFDISPEMGLERVESRGEKSKFERLDYLKKVRRNYLKIAKEKGFVIIDASENKDHVLASVMEHISKII